MDFSESYDYCKVTAPMNTTKRNFRGNIKIFFFILKRI